jgi:outer membrane receptor for ferrienterochelin and colicin
LDASGTRLIRCTPHRVLEVVMTFSRSIILAAVALTALGASAAAQESKSTKKDRSVITADEIATAQVATVYQVIEKLRPYYLRRAEQPRTIYGRTGNTSVAGEDSPAPGAVVDGGSESTELVVYVDGTEVGGVGELQRIQSDQVEQIRYLSGPDAQQQYGPRYAAGVVQVTLKH